MSQVKHTQTPPIYSVALGNQTPLCRAPLCVESFFESGSLLLSCLRETGSPLSD
jgi:hypothetical protein